MTVIPHDQIPNLLDKVRLTEILLQRTALCIYTHEQLLCVPCRPINNILSFGNFTWLSMSLIMFMLHQNCMSSNMKRSVLIERNKLQFKWCELIGCLCTNLFSQTSKSNLGSTNVLSVIQMNIPLYDASRMDNSQILDHNVRFSRFMIAWKGFSAPAFHNKFDSMNGEWC